jgi:hypothetical protein
MLFGDACTEVNMPVARAAKYWNIVQVGMGKARCTDMYFVACS